MRGGQAGASGWCQHGNVERRADWRAAAAPPSPALCGSSTWMALKDSTSEFSLQNCRMILITLQTAGPTRVAGRAAAAAAGNAQWPCRSSPAPITICVCAESSNRPPGPAVPPLHSRAHKLGAGSVGRPTAPDSGTHSVASISRLIAARPRRAHRAGLAFCYASSAFWRGICFGQSQSHESTQRGLCKRANQP